MNLRSLHFAFMEVQILINFSEDMRSRHNICPILLQIRTTNSGSVDEPASNQQHSQPRNSQYSSYGAW